MPTATLENRETDAGVKLQRVLVPVDFSEESADALRHALSLADKAVSMRIDVLHVWNVSAYAGAGLVPSEVTGGSQETVSIWVAQHAADTMEAFLDRVAGKREGEDPIRAYLESGDPLEHILKSSSEYDAIFVGAKDPDGAEELILGSVAQGVIADAKCAVYSVRG